MVLGVLALPYGSSGKRLGDKSIESCGYLQSSGDF